jgi:hypothetical protein
VKQTKHPETIKSPFQKEVFNASHPVKTSEFKSSKDSQYHANKKFFAGKDKNKYKAGLFSQAKKTSPTGNRTYAGADEKSRMGDETYKTTQNAFGSKMSRSAGQTSSMADEKYSTKGNPAVMNETTNTKRPLFLNDSTPGYSEDDIKKLLNKE